MILFILLLAQIVSAETTTQPCDHARAIYENEIAPKSSSSFLETGADVCKITWTPKAGQTITFVDKQAQRAALLAELGALEDKIDAGTNLTAAEVRRAFKIMFKLLRISKEP